MRYADLELALLAVGEIAGEPRSVAAEMHAQHQLLGTREQIAQLPHRCEEVQRLAAARLHREAEIFDHAEVLEQVVALKRARDAQPAHPVGRPTGDDGVLDEDAAGAGFELSADLVDQAGLAGAVRPDDDVALARLDGEVDVVGDDETAERAAEMIGAQHAHGLLLRQRTCRSVPQMPPGKNSTQQIKMAPMMASQCSL